MLFRTDHPPTTSQTTSQAPAQPATSEPPITTLRTSTRLVVVDVVVSDGKGRPVHNLSPSDFTLLEGGKPMPLRQVEEHTPTTSAALHPPQPRLGRGVYTNYSVLPERGALNILLLDTLNTPLEDQAFVRQETIHYLKDAGPGQRIAIFGLSAQLRLLQGFTSDPAMLRKALDQKKAGLSASPLLDNAQSSQEDPLDSASQDLVDQTADTPSGDQISAHFSQFQAERTSAQLALRVRVTLEGLDALARYLSSIPGRKNLIWFSGAFPINILPNGDLQYPFVAAESMADQFRDTANLLARSQVSVYPIDARGLMGAPLLDAVGTGPQMAGDFARHQEEMLNDASGGQSTMMLMAENTGGKAFINTNNLKQAVEKAVEAGSNYYTLSYSPADKNWHGDYRKLEIKLAHSGYHLAYRRGYFADDPDAPVTKGSAASQRPILSFNPLRVAMLLASPDATEILFNAAVRPTTGQPEAEAAPGNRLDASVKGPFKRLTITIKADARNMTATVGPRGRHLEIAFLTYVYTDKGKAISTRGDLISTDVPEEKFAAMVRDGVAFTQQVSVPDHGEYFLRIGVHDRTSDHIGALEVPVFDVIKLPPASTP